MRDREIERLIKKEKQRQEDELELIPSENYASKEVREALASFFVNKYSEGYPGKRYYGGNEIVDELEKLVIDRAKKLFRVPFANVQPYSGSPANLAVYLALCKPEDQVIGMSLTAGGHLSHGHSVSATGILFRSIQYGLRKKNLYVHEDLFDYDEIENLAKKHQPKIIWVGASAYPLMIDFQKFSQIAEKVSAYLVADIAHIAGLVVGGVHPSPVPYAHIITTTTHKTLRGPRGAMILVTEKGIAKDPGLPEKINQAVFPGLQGGPHDHQIAAIGVALYEASQPSFKSYAQQVVKNSRLLAKILLKNGLSLIGGGSDNHLTLVDLTPLLGPGTGIFVQKAFDLVGISINKNSVPNESGSSFYPSGIRLGTPAVTSRGMKEKEIEIIGEKIVEVIYLVKDYFSSHQKNFSFITLSKEKKRAFIKKFEEKIQKNRRIKEIKNEIKNLARQFPIP
ncbi:MAG: serine hydroxymethyltransferase [Patescibacteria group bacterium]|nr:serine hydroxymethyltransferase [Patescibacteria group bacterium]